MAETCESALAKLGRELDELESLTDVDRSRVLLRVTSAVREVAQEAKALDVARADEARRASSEVEEATARARRVVADEEVLSNVERRVAQLLYEHGDLRGQFVEFDSSGDSRVSVDEFRYALSRLGLRLTDGEARSVVRAYDTNGDGKINYEELVRFVAESDWRPGDLGDPRGLAGRSTAPLPAPADDSDESTRRARAIAILRQRIRSKFGSARDAWLVLHPHGDASGSMRVKDLAGRLRTYTGLSISPKALRSLLNSDSKTVSFPAFNTLASAEAGPGIEFEEEEDARAQTAPVGSRGRGLSRTVRAVARASAERRSSSTGRGRPAKDTRPARPMAKVLEAVQFGLERTSHSAKDLHERMRRHSELGVDEDDIVWGFKRYLKAPVSTQEARNILAAFDADHDGQLSFGEFLGLLRAAAEAGGAM